MQVDELKQMNRKLPSLPLDKIVQLFQKYVSLNISLADLKKVIKQKDAWSEKVVLEHSNMTVEMENDQKYFSIELALHDPRLVAIIAGTTDQYDPENLIKSAFLTLCYLKHNPQEGFLKGRGEYRTYQGAPIQ